MRIIFLDIDGVLNNEDTEDRCGYYIGIEDAKVELLKQIVDETGAKIVLSSTWRLGIDNRGHRLEGHIPYLQEKLGKYGLEVFDKTKQLSKYGDLRGKEIHEWLSRHPDVDGWVVLDDEFFWDFNDYDIPRHRVQTWFYTSRGEGGLTEKNVKQAIKILKGEFDYE